jgi:phytoene synthase
MSQNDAGDLLRSADYDLWLSTLFLPDVREQQRAALVTLFAFHLSLAQISGQVSEPMLGEIRLQWWHDVINGQRGDEARGHPLMAEFLALCKAYHLPTQNLSSMIDARRFDLYDDPMPHWVELEAYCGETTSLLFRLAVLICNDGEDIDCADAAGHAGVAYKLTEVARAFVRAPDVYKKCLPIELLQLHHASHQDDFAAQPALVHALTQELCARIFDHLARAEAAMSGLPRQLRAAFMPLALVRDYVKKLRRMKAGQGGFVDVSPLYKMWRFWRYSHSDRLRS